MGWQFLALSALVFIALAGIAAFVRRAAKTPENVLENFYPELD